jgi:hypothetical protein
VFRTIRAVLGLAGLLAFAAFVVPRIVPAVNASLARFRHAGRHAAESEDAVLARFRTPEYVAAIRRIRETIPRDAAYFLVPGGPDDGKYFVRFDLAPRRAIVLEIPDETPDGASSEGAPGWVVLPRIDPPGPEVFTTAVFFGERVRR